MKRRYLGLVGIVAVSLFALLPFISFIIVSLKEAAQPSDEPHSTMLTYITPLLALTVPFLLGIWVWWHLKLFHTHKKLYWVGVSALLPAILVNGFLGYYERVTDVYFDLNEKHDVAAWATMKDGERIQFDNYSEEFIYWPGIREPVGIRIKWDMVLPEEMKNTPVTMAEPYIVDAETAFKVEDDYRAHPSYPRVGIVASLEGDLTHAGGEYFKKFMSPFPSGLHVITDEMAPALSGTRITLTYELFPLKLRDEYSGMMCIHRAEKAPSVTPELKQLATIYFLQYGGTRLHLLLGSEIDLAQKLLNLITHHSKLITPETIAKLYDNLNANAMKNAGYGSCRYLYGLERANVECFCRGEQ